MLRDRQNHGPPLPGERGRPGDCLGHQRGCHRRHRPGTLRPGHRQGFQGRYFQPRFRRRSRIGHQSRLRRCGYPYQQRRHHHQQQDFCRADRPGHRPYHGHRRQGGHVRDAPLHWRHAFPRCGTYLQHHFIGRYAGPSQNEPVHRSQVGRHWLERESAP